MRHKFHEAAMLLVERENTHKQLLEHAQRHASSPPSHIQENEVDEDQAVKYMCTRCRGSLCCSAYVPQLESGSSSSGSCNSSSSEHGWDMDDVQHPSGGEGFDNDGQAGPQTRQHYQHQQHQRQQQQQQQQLQNASEGRVYDIDGQAAPQKRQRCQQQQQQQQQQQGPGAQLMKRGKKLTGTSEDAACYEENSGSPLHERVCAGCVQAGEHVWHVRLISVQACKQAGLQAAVP
ncbi:hypothetical protein DUNSADRAFT_7062 [Dunaliella salina]|uniref:Encoded protein n=1 Tax=Dunaliella salina TaxID=3046 RepID=A0ABQ7H6G4_DUNSA|nr:hypothetical protein DUNSADRAFT_7062 [Dunaliella salina]|eukprot:KAF5842453.1 hypothetical protein DUNSADRAFT_7062 [Dunaliella salina]